MDIVGGLYRQNKKQRVEIERLREAVRERDGVLEMVLLRELRLREALDFYADPETYFGLMVLGDPPCGAFADDFSEDHGHPYLDGPRYGKTARAALAGEEETK